MKKWARIFGITFLLFLFFYSINIVIEYKSGIATLKYIGEPNLEISNLDREYRCYNYTQHCSALGYEHLFYEINNNLVKWLIKNYGYQQKSYIGFYPTEQESMILLKTEGKEIRLKDESIAIRYEDERTFIEIDPSEPQNVFFKQEFYDNTEPNSETKALICEKDSCLVIKLENSPNKSALNNIYLFDKSKMCQFAMYNQKDHN